MIGKGGNELLQTNVGSALPSINTVQRQISQGKITEWDAPLCVKIHIDHTRGGLFQDPAI